MTTADWLTIAGIAVAIVFGIAGFITAHGANRRAKESNRLAEVANGIAQSAVTKARAANKLAKDANKLSEDANALVKRTIAHQQEDWLVKWNAEWDEEAGTITLTNRGRDAALELSVTVTGDDIHRVYRRSEAAEPGDEVVITFPEFLEKRPAFNAAADATWHENLRHGIFGTPRLLKTDVEVFVRWKTGEGLPGSEDLQLEMS
jgi:hypothetical protein